jgi:hypothetical protein
MIDTPATRMGHYPCHDAEPTEADPGCVECGACEDCSPSPFGRVDGRCRRCVGSPASSNLKRIAAELAAMRGADGGGL